MTKIYNESFFDEVFSNTTKTDYKNLEGKFGRRDYKITKLLQDYGISNKECLDIGPGTGKWLHYISGYKPLSISALDISDVSIERCRNLCDNIYKIDVEQDHFPISNDKFDIVVSFMVLEHLRTPTNYLSEIIRVSKEK